MEDHSVVKNTNNDKSGNADDIPNFEDNVVRSSMPQKSHRARERQMAFSLILICVMYLVFTTPYYLYFFMALQPYFDQTPKRWMDTHIAFGFNSIVLVQCNAALNIFVLLLVGSKFRKDLVGMLRKPFNIK